MYLIYIISCIHLLQHQNSHAIFLTSFSNEYPIPHTIKPTITCAKNPFDYKIKYAKKKHVHITISTLLGKQIKSFSFSTTPRQTKKFRRWELKSLLPINSYSCPFLQTIKTTGKLGILLISISQLQITHFFLSFFLLANTRLRF